IHFPISWRHRHARRQLVLGRGYGRLDVLGSAVEVTRQVELDRYICDPKRANRSHRIDAGDGRKLPLQRGSNRRCHRVRVGPGQTGRYRYGREVYIGQVADRQQAIAHDPEQEYPHHDQRGHYRPSDEQLGYTHWAVSLVMALAVLFLISTRAPGNRRSWPSVTTVSPATSPLSITVSVSLPLPRTTALDSTVLSCLTTYTNCPDCPT